MPAGRRSRWPLVALAVAVLGGIAVAVVAGVRSAPSAAPVAAAPSAAPGARIADERLADPCALVRPTALSRFGQVRPLTDFDLYESCSLDVTRPGAAAASVRLITALLHPTAVARAGGGQPVGELEIARPPGDAKECVRMVVLPDDHGIQFDALVLDGAATDLDLCAVAEAGLADALLTVLDRGVPTRAAPAGGLAGLDACALARPAVDAEPGSAGLAARPEFGGWSCAFGEPDTSGRPPVFVRFVRLYDGGGSGAERVTLGGTPRTGSRARTAARSAWWGGSTSGPRATRSWRWRSWRPRARPVPPTGADARPRWPRPSRRSCRGDGRDDPHGAAGGDRSASCGMPVLRAGTPRS